jgi:hypothetical protein
MGQEAELYQSDIKSLRNTIQDLVNDKKNMQAELGNALVKNENERKDKVSF